MSRIVWFIFFFWGGGTNDLGTQFLRKCSIRRRRAEIRNHNVSVET